MTGILRSTRAVFFVLGALLSACSGGGGDGVTNPPPPATGALSVSVTGLPAGASATITVTGPSGFTRTLGGTETISGLAPGSYSVAATSVTASDGRYAPTPAAQTITVAAGTTPASATVAYALATGSLTISVSGLPAGANAAVTLTGPNAFSRLVTSTTTIQSLDPGSYTVAAANVSTTDDVFAASAPSQAVTVFVGATPAAATVAYALATGRLTVTVTGLPAAFGPLAAVNAAVTVTGPNGFQQVVQATQTLTKLMPGNYTIAAANVTAALYRYAVSTPSQVAIVTASATPVNVNCAYSAIDGALTVDVSGLPAGTNASVNVTGPGGFSRSITGSTTVSSVPPGTYTVTATAITIGQTQYTPTPLTQNVSVSAGVTASAAVAYSAPVSLRLTQVVSGLSRPVHMVSPPGDARMFVVEQTGRIRIIQNGQILAQAFLDMTSKILPPQAFGDEQGLLGLVFHPQYATNGFFFVLYMDPAMDMVVERYQVSANANVANTTGTAVIRIPHTQSRDHNGGGLVFGTDGYLYFSIGDGGCCYDPAANGQNLNTLLGKIMRIDVSVIPYNIPTSNPFVGQANRRGEIWGYGLRNPWRFDIDPANGTVYIADVGEDDREEVNAIPSSTAGSNFGWPLAEGTLCLQSGCTNPAFRTPIVEYSHAEGCSITGGFVYRGTQIPELQGHYFYSDWCEGFLRSVLYVNGTLLQSKNWMVPPPGFVTSFGKDGTGELYLLTQAGVVWKIVRQ